MAASRHRRPVLFVRAALAAAVGWAEAVHRYHRLLHPRVPVTSTSWPVFVPVAWALSPWLAGPGAPTEILREGTGRKAR